jgi:hypothetical protein
MLKGVDMNHIKITSAKMAVVLLLFCVAVTGSVFAQNTGLDAVIREFAGDVEVKTAGGEWVPARAGMTLASNTLISTGFHSTAVLDIGNSSVMVRPLTRLSLDELVALGKNERVGLNLRVGRVRAEVTPPEDGTVGFTVLSPMVTASVRGTVFEFNSVNLAVQSGTVAFTGRDAATVFATAGKTSFVDRQGRSVIPVRGEDRQLAQVSAGVAAGVTEDVAFPVSGPASPVVAGPGGTLTVPGVIGAPGGGVIEAAPAAGLAAIGAGW